MKILKQLRKFVIIVNLIIVLAYIIFTPAFMKFFSSITGNLTSEMITLCNFIYIMLIIAVLVSIVDMHNSKKNNEKFSFFSVLTVIFFGITIINATPFRYVYHYEKKNSDSYYYPKSYRYDRLFVYNYVYSNEGDDESGTGEDKYFYIPVLKIIIFVGHEGVKVEKVRYIGNKKVEIGDLEYTIEKDYFTES
ncbi:MAG: hypothetical protein VZS44_02020 [Bacilli bacterium]|nr:hypothetical protein [Bacilli bacterium]